LIGWRRTYLADDTGQIIGMLGSGADITERMQIEEALRARERYQRAVLDNFPFMVWLKDRDSRILAANTAYARVAGIPTADDLVGKTDLDFWAPAMAAQFMGDDQAVLGDGQPRTVEEEIDAAGQRRWLETYKSPVELDGKIIGTVGFAGTSPTASAPSWSWPGTGTTWSSSSRPGRRICRWPRTPPRRRTGQRAPSLPT
jgi:PAS domain S-box-containing protein